MKNNRLKLSILMMLLGINQAMSAMNTPTIAAIDVKNVQAFHDTLAASETTRSRCNKAIIGAVVAAALYGSYRYVLKPSANYVYDWATGKHAEDRREIEGRIIEIDRRLSTMEPLAGWTVGQLNEVKRERQAMGAFAGQMEQERQRLIGRLNALEGEVFDHGKQEAVEAQPLVPPLEQNDNNHVGAINGKEGLAPAVEPIGMEEVPVEQPKPWFSFNGIKNFFGYGNHEDDPRGEKEADRLNNIELFQRAQSLSRQAAELQYAAAKKAGYAGWGGWFKNKAHSAGTALGSWATYLPLLIGGQYITSVAGTSLASFLPFGKILKRKADQAGDFLWQSRTMNWVLKTHTTFEAQLKKFVNWTLLSTQADTRSQKEVDALKWNLLSGGRALVRDAEKILGYMHFVKSQLSIEHDFDRQTADESMGQLTTFVNELVGQINQFIAANNDMSARIAVMSTTLKTALLNIITALESFQSVELAAGYEPNDDHDRFAMMRRYVDPEEFARKTPFEQEQEADFDFQRELLQMMNMQNRGGAHHHPAHK